MSPALLKHKLKKLKEWQLVRLRNAIANRRVLEFDSFEDFLLENPKAQAAVALPSTSLSLQMK